MPATRLSEQHCSIARTLAVVGERWTLVIMRDVLLGFGGFRELQRRTGASSNILSDRLKGLVEQGIIERHPVAGHADAVDYRPTRKGLDLLPVLIALNRWGDVHAPLPEGRPGSRSRRRAGPGGQAAAATRHRLTCTSARGRVSSPPPLPGGWRAGSR